MKIDQLGFIRNKAGCFVFHNIGVFHSPVDTVTAFKPPTPLDYPPLTSDTSAARWAYRDINHPRMSARIRTLFTALPTSKEIMSRVREVNPTNPKKFCRRDLCNLTSRKILNTTKGTIELISGKGSLEFADWTWEEDVKPYLQKGSQLEEKWMSFNVHARWTVRGKA
jgi:hypothetical protein